MSNDVVSIQNLSFKYKGQSKECISNLSLQIAAGSRFGLFGPNGAGKTTLMNCLTGLLQYHQGSIKLFNVEINKCTQKVKPFFGLVPQDFSFYQELSPMENLAFFGAWYGMDKQAIKTKSIELMEVLNLTDVKDKPVQEFSGGMKRRVNLAIGVLHSPKILFLDEPTVGVDILTRQAIIDYLKTLNKKGTTLIYTSHQLSEAEELCDTVALIDEGKILAHNTLSNLLLQYKAQGLEKLFIQLTNKKSRCVS